MADYAEFLARKRKSFGAFGVTVNDGDLHPSLFDYQKDLTRWALRKGRACVFAATGLGKTRIEIEFARLGGRRSLIVAPLAVGWQTAKEAESMGVGAKVVRSQDEVGGDGVYIVNYERLHLIDASQFDCAVLDESSILKGFDGTTRKQIQDMFGRTPMKLACTATPAPNDHMELGTHAEFVGAGTRAEMLATYFVHDGGDTSKWRLKRHAVAPFWDWVTTWGAFVGKPSDLGYDDAGHELPPLIINEHTVDGHYEPTEDGALFHFGAMSATKVHDHMRKTSQVRAEKVAEIAAGRDTFLTWCHTNYDQDAVLAALPGQIDVRGSDQPDAKEKKLKQFSEHGGRMLTKPSIAGFGLNWQHCNEMAFAGLSYSWEAMHQAIRRCWRFGQTKPVTVHVVSADTESAIAETIRAKESAYDEMAQSMREAMARKAEDFR